jgi:putative hydrolase of the HAD superfamily
MPFNRDIWVFDLDNTLYPASANLFALMDIKMGEYVAQIEGVDLIEAKRIQKAYFRDYGTTLSGLMARHSIDPNHYLDYVHDIDLDVLTADHGLAASIDALPGRKLVFTNADSDYGQRVLDRLGLGHCFEAMFDIRDANYVPKPEAAPYDAFCVRHGVDPARAIMFEDMARNLAPAKAIGMGTVWINNGSEQAVHLEDASHIDHETDALAPWLANHITALRSAA